MVRAARSGVQNITEGSQAAGASRKMEMKLTNVARASLEELRLDYEDFLRHRDLVMYPPSHPVLERFKGWRCRTLEDVRGWIVAERVLAGTARTRGAAQTGGTAQSKSANRTNVPSMQSVPVPGTAQAPVPSSAALAANAALSLINLCCLLLDRQLVAQATAFQKEGGFTERLYRVRSEIRKGQSGRNLP